MFQWWIDGIYLHLKFISMIWSFNEENKVIHNTIGELSMRFEHFDRCFVVMLLINNMLKRKTLSPLLANMRINAGKL